MASGAPTTQPEGQAPPTLGTPARDPWWRQWLEPAVAVAIITALVIALISVGVAGFESLKGYIRDTKGDIRDTETRLSADITASEARQRQDLKDLRAELKADNRALSDKLDHVLETLLTART